MSGQRSHRPRKSIDYSKLSSDKQDIDMDDDDFIKTTPSKKRKGREKGQNNSQDNVFSDRNKTAPIERRARNRLSEEEKYNKQLEEALKLSIIDASKIDKTQKSFDKDVNIIQHDACVPLTVHVEVMDSPMSKKRKSMEITEKAQNLNVSSCVKNGAILPGSDRITPLPTKDITAKPLNSRRCRRAVTKRDDDDDDYKLSDESESNEDDDETFEDFQDVSPVKKKNKAVSAKSSIKKENKVTPKAIVKNVVKSQKPSLTSNSAKMPSDTRQVCTKTMPSASPMTPKSINVSVKSPGLLQKKFIQRGWTPPGPAGLKTSTLKSSPSPTCVRVGLSRNARISPLHPRTIIR